MHTLPSPSPSTSNLSRRRESRKRRAPELSKPNSNNGKSPHVYTEEQESFIAKLLAVPETWRLLYGPSHKTPNNENKTDIRKTMLQSINAKFGLDLNDKQLKNKISTMMKCWNTANKEYKKTGNGDLDKVTLEEIVENICHYFFTLYSVASESVKLNSPEICELTNNLYPKGHVTVDEPSESEQSYDDEIKPTTSQKGRQQSKDAIQPPKETEPVNTKRRRGNGDDMVSMLQILTEKAEQEQERRIKLDEQKLELQRELLEMDRRFKARQEQQMILQEQQMKIDIKMSEVKLRTMEAEILAVEAETELKKAQAEVLKAQLKSGESVELTIFTYKKSRKSQSLSPRSPS
ncbi:hypothetical protein BGX21_003060 [Mortierella sp. AD011]|nr:hypothetical protein BGX20_003214 [Mortierella sp. AD010]KAF9400970.1 hypothetical protein BGX21_003060 [Mortierella sp. AD011]